LQGDLLSHVKMKMFWPVVSLFATFFSGCGQSDEAPNGASATKSDVESISSRLVDPISYDSGVTIVRMSGNDTMKFNVEAFTVKTGETVKVFFENTGKMSKTSMGHNVVFLAKEVDEAVFATKASQAKSTEYIPNDSGEEVIAHTALLGPGESDEIEFAAPAPGEYVFICSFPAHMYAGMRGIMTVTE